MTETRQIPLQLLLNNEGQIKGVPRNPRQITEEAFNKLKKSLEDSDLTDFKPLIVYPYGEQFVVLGGNMRLRALRELGVPDVSCIVVPEGTPVAHLKKIVILDNNEFGEYDWDAIANEWSEEPLQDWGVVLPVWNEEKSAKVEQAQQDVFDEDADAIDARCARGDIWQLGEHRLMCGDSTSESDVELLLNGTMADIAFTSPPYGVGIDYGEYIDTFENTKSLVERALPIMARHTKDYCILNWGDIVSAKAINHTEQPSMYSWLPLYIDIMKKCGFYLWAERIWTKPHARCSGIWSANSNRPVSDWEYVYTFAQSQPSYNERGGNSHFGVIDTSEDSECDTLSKHPAAFPVMIPSRVITAHTKPDAIVLDVFGGSGTTLIAAEQLNRKCYIMEMDPHYCDITLARWEKYTGKTAVKL